MERFIVAALAVLTFCAIAVPGQAENLPPPIYLEGLIAAVEAYAAEEDEGPDHVERWKRVLAALGAGTHPQPMTAAEAQIYANRKWERWLPVVGALKVIEAANQKPRTLIGELGIAVVGGLIVILIIAMWGWISAGGLVRLLGGVSQSRVTELQNQLERAAAERASLTLRVTHLESQRDLSGC